MRIVIISDTHGLHEDLGDLSGDLLIHCGDFEDAVEIDAWFSRQPFDQIVAVGGNHDHGAAESSRENVRVFYNAVYLEDAILQHQGLNLYGSPWIGDLEGAAFALDGDEIHSAWDAIPDDTDVLITHVPPFGILDQARNGENWGCRLLRDRVETLNLRWHCFGHVHASYGQCDHMGITFYNASNLSGGEIRNPPIVIDL